MLGVGIAIATAGLTVLLLSGIERLTIAGVLFILICFLIVYQFAEVRALYGSRESEGSNKMNCPECGARIPVSSEDCEYCDAPIQ